MKKQIIIGSRGSKLALIYANKAKEELIKNSQIQNIEIKSIKTAGDTIKNVRLSDSGGKGMFCKTIERELLDEKIDIAVHALKDMPTSETEGLVTNCFLERNNPREILISNGNKCIKDLKVGAVVGTSSFRREFQLKNLRKDLNCKLIRGNVDTRMKKLNDNLYDAIILSYAGIKLLGLKNKVSQIFPVSEIIPSAGQGTIALQCRKDDEKSISLLEKINHQPTNICVTAERDVLKILEGDCETAVGIFAKIRDENICLEAELYSLNGKQRFYSKLSKSLNLAGEIGIEVGKILKKKSNSSYKR